jgi:glycosyltransferase involved in cell wall biosynthesis
MRRQNPRILYISSNCPFAKSYGGQLRTLNIGRLLKQVGEVALVLASSDTYSKEELDNTRREFDLKRTIKFDHNERFGFIDRIRHEIDPYFLKTHQCRASKDDREFMLRMINDHDGGWIHNIRVANSFLINRWPHSVLDIDDIPSRVYLSLAHTTSNIMRKTLDFRMSLMWRRRERLFKERFDLFTVCSEEDKRYIGNNRVHVLPNGFDIPKEISTRNLLSTPRLGFIGHFKYLPNMKGIEWFLQHVWPLIKTSVPNAHLRLVGEGSDTQNHKLGDDVEALGWVGDPSEEIATWNAMIVPIRTGGGTRIKLAEGFARKCPVVSTTLGAFGYDVVNGQELLIADDARDFALACARLLVDLTLGKSISDKAWSKFRQKWTWSSYSKLVQNVIEECLRR